MMEDALIAEVRAVRHAISEECGHDLRRLQERCQALQTELRASGRHEVWNAPDMLACRNTPAPAGAEH